MMQLCLFHNTLSTTVRRTLVTTVLCLAAVMPFRRTAGAAPETSDGGRAYPVDPGPLRLDPAGDDAPLLTLGDDKGKLRKFEEGATKKRGSDKSAPPQARPRHDPSTSTSALDDDDDEDDCWDIIGFIFYESARLLVRWVADSEPVTHHTPYEDPAWAYARWTMTPGNFDAILRADVSRVETGLWARHAGLDLRFPRGYAFEGDVTGYAEDVPDQRHDDHLLWVTATASKTIVANGAIYSTVGMGMASLVGAEGHTSVAFQNKTDIFPFKPVGVHLRVLFSPMSGATLSEVEGRIGYHVRRAEVFAGWRAFLHSRAPDLSGPLAGVAWWF
jgi:hypothetical protein